MNCCDTVHSNMCCFLVYLDPEERGGAGAALSAPGQRHLSPQTPHGRRASSGALPQPHHSYSCEWTSKLYIAGALKFRTI